MALREFALGIESLERFTRGELLYRVHECAFGILALESEPVDPRLWRRCKGPASRREPHALSPGLADTSLTRHRHLADRPSDARRLPRAVVRIS